MRTVITSLLAASALVACTDDTSLTSSDIAASGALVAMDMDSQVGVLLDELPAGPAREAAAANALAQPASFWQDRAKRQTRLMDYRLVFRAQTTTRTGRTPATSTARCRCRLTARGRSRSRGRRTGLRSAATIW